MRRIFNFARAALLLSLILMLGGCGSDESSAKKTDNGNSVENVINGQMASADAEQNETNAGDAAGAEKSDTETEESDAGEASPKTAEQEDRSDTASAGADSEAAGAETVDYDLTAMNSDMVYATVYQMLVNPDLYIGKTVKMSGPFYPYTNADETVYYPACIIEDATACCAQGMEFVLSGAKYPDDYPETGEVITVTGTFETYMEGEYLYCHLTEASLES